MTGYGPPPEQQPPYGAPQGQPPGQPPQGQYGQPQYGQPAGAGYGQPTAAYPAARTGRTAASPGVAGIVLAIIGAAALVISFTAVKWFSEFPGGKFSDVHKVLNDSGAGAAGLAKAYFGWLAWVLAAVAVVAAIIANLPSPASPAFRAIGALVAAAGIVVTFFAIEFQKHGPGYSQYIKHAQVGFYLALGGFLVTGIGALIGPRRPAVVVM